MATDLPLRTPLMCEHVYTRVFLKYGADLSILLSQKTSGSCKVLAGSMMVMARDLGPEFIPGPNACLPEAVIVNPFDAPRRLWKLF